MCVCTMLYTVYMYTILYTMILYSLGDKFCNLLVNYALFVPLSNNNCYLQITGTTVYRDLLAMIKFGGIIKFYNWRD